MARYAFAIVVAIVAILARLAFDPLWGLRLPYITLFPAIMVSAWLGGLWPGIVTTLITGTAATYFWIEPAYSFRVNDPSEWFGVLVFVAVGTVISGLNEAWRRDAVALAESEARLNLADAAIWSSTERAAADLQAMTRLHRVGTQCMQAGAAFSECLDEILNAAIDFTSAEKGNVQLVDASGALTIASHRGFDPPFLEFFATVRGSDASACGAATQSIRRVIVEDVTKSHIFAGQPSLGPLVDAGVRAVQSTPLVSSSGAVLGVISTHFTRPHRPNERELGLLDLLARQAADYLERTAFETRLRESQTELSLEVQHMSQLHALSVQMAQAGDIGTLLKQILAAAADLVGTDKGNIQLLDAKTGQLRIVVHQGLGPRLVQHFAEHGWAATCDEAHRRVERVIIEDVAAEPSVQGPVELEIVLEDGIRAIQSTPLVTRSGRFLGMLNNHFRFVHRPSDRDLRYLDLLARMAADLIEHKQAEQREQEMRRSAEEANRLKDHFLAVAAHEHRTPLNARSEPADAE